MADSQMEFGIINAHKEYLTTQEKFRIQHLMKKVEQKIIHRVQHISAKKYAQKRRKKRRPIPSTRELLVQLFTEQKGGRDRKRKTLKSTGFVSWWRN